MAKIFYTLDEAAAKLKMSETQVKELVSSGQLQEFRDRDRLMFKVDQINLLAQGEHGGEEGMIPLAESGELGAISLASDSGSGMNLESPKEQTGISIFDTDQTEEAEPLNRRPARLPWCRAGTARGWPPAAPGTPRLG